MFGRAVGESYEGHFRPRRSCCRLAKIKVPGPRPQPLVRTTVIEEPAFRLANEPLDENDMRDLPNFFPLALRGQHRLLSTRRTFVGSRLSNNAQPVR
jgi:hypothetical protein